MVRPDSSRQYAPSHSDCCRNEHINQSEPVSVNPGVLLKLLGESYDVSQGC